MGGSLAHKYAAVRDDAVLDRETLILEHLPQVRLIAKRIHNRLPRHISLEDLISTGIVGLLRAIDNFDPSANVQLKTYADRRIHGEIMDSLRAMDWASRDTRNKARLIGAAIQVCQGRLAREPSEEEIARELRIDPAEYQRWLGLIQTVEVCGFEYAGDGQPDLLQFIGDDEENWPSRVVERHELDRILALAIERMPKLERTILNLYYYEELNLSEISKVVGLHLSRVAQLRTQAVLRLRSHLQRVWPPSGSKH
jgi:RNA polymerase sigma factor for flagellar operon FliA